MPIALDQDRAVWQFFGQKSQGFFIEVGANDPFGGSQTWLLEQNGWKGILIEPQQQFSQRLKAARPGSQVFGVACARPTGREWLTSIFRQTN